VRVRGCRLLAPVFVGILAGILSLAFLPREATAAPTITFKGGGLDEFRFHGRVELVPPELGGTIDPITAGFGFELSNEHGVIYAATLEPFDFEYMGNMRYRFRDTAARVGAGSRGGIFHVFSRFRQYHGVWWYTVRILAYGDLSRATEPVMTLKWFQVGTINDQVPQLTVEWDRLSDGWRLPLSRF
jgi:hypothetical protein